MSSALGPPQKLIPPPHTHTEEENDYYLWADPSPGDLEMTLSGDAARGPEVCKPQSYRELRLMLLERASISSRKTSKLASDTGLEGSSQDQAGVLDLTMQALTKYENLDFYRFPVLTQ